LRFATGAFLSGEDGSRRCHEPSAALTLARRPFAMPTVNRPARNREMAVNSRRQTQRLRRAEVLFIQAEGWRLAVRSS